MGGCRRLHELLDGVGLGHTQARLQATPRHPCTPPSPVKAPVEVPVQSITLLSPSPMQNEEGVDWQLCEFQRRHICIAVTAGILPPSLES